MDNNNLKRFADIILDQATVRKKNTEQELSERRTGQLEQTKQDLELYFEKELETQIREISAENNLRLTQRETELLRELLQMRQNISNEVFAEVEKGVRAFTETGAYKVYIEAESKEVSSVFGESTALLCVCMQQDLPLLKSVISDTRVKFAESEADIIGGFVLQSEDMRLYADCSLQTALEKEKARFADTEELTLNV